MSILSKIFRCVFQAALFSLIVSYADTTDKFGDSTVLIEEAAKNSSKVVISIYDYSNGWKSVFESDERGIIENFASIAKTVKAELFICMCNGNPKIDFLDKDGRLILSLTNHHWQSLRVFGWHNEPLKNPDAFRARFEKCGINIKEIQ